MRIEDLRSPNAGINSHQLKSQALKMINYIECNSSKTGKHSSAADVAAFFLSCARAVQPYADAERLKELVKE